MDKEIFQIKKDFDRAKALIVYAKDRLILVERHYVEDRRYKVVEEAYEAIKELLTSIIFIDGYKTLSHIKLIEYFNENYDLLSDSQKMLLDIFRKLRHGVVYYGENVTKDFLDNNYEEVLDIIKKLIKFVESRLK